MKKIFLAFVVAFCIQAVAKDNYTIAAFSGLSEDQTLIFQFSKARNAAGKIYRKVYSLPCKLKNLRIIAIGASECFKSNKDFKKFQKEYKQSIESVIKPGKRYYVNLIDRGNDAYVCDASDPKSNLRLDLVAAGFAVPTTDDSELLLKAAEEAKEAKRGMYSAKFWDVTNCILNGVPMPKKIDE